MKGKVLVVLTFGHVLVGDVETAEAGAVVLENAATVRRWGTTSGLGQLAAEGPTTDTTLDTYAAPVTVERSQIIFTIPCGAGW